MLMQATQTTSDATPDPSLPRAALLRGRYVLVKAGAVSTSLVGGFITHGIPPTSRC